MDAKEQRETFKLGGHLIPVLLDEKFHGHKAESVALKALEARGYLSGMKDPSVVALVEFLKKLIKESLYYPNPAETMGSFVECRHCKGGIKTTYRDGAWRFDELSKPITHDNDCPIGDINEVLAQYHAATKEEGK